VYFAFVRPAVLPEDARYLGRTTAQIQSAVPGLARWLKKIFWVTGGDIVTTGILILYVARTAFLAQSGRANAVIGVTSIGAMTATNCVLGSDVRWMLLGVALLWIVARALSARGT